MLNTPKLKLALIAAGVLAFSFAGGAWADEILAYGQTSGRTRSPGQKTERIHRPRSALRMSRSRSPIRWPRRAICSAHGFHRYEQNAATNVGGVGGTDSQNYSGTFCISQLAGCTGTLLDGSYIDTLSGKDGEAV